MVLGLVALIGSIRNSIIYIQGEFAFVWSGIYIIWSWDIMEPMVYFQTFGASIFLASQFFKFHNDYDN